MAAGGVCAILAGVKTVGAPDRGGRDDCLLRSREAPAIEADDDGDALGALEGSSASVTRSVLWGAGDCCTGGEGGGGGGCLGDGEGLCC